MPRTLRLLAVCAIALTTTVLGQSPASAATGHKTDKVGDAPGIIDIAGFTVRNDLDRVVMTADVPGLRNRGGFTFEYSTSRYGGFYVFARRNGGGPAVEARYCGEIRCNDVQCDGLDVRWSTGRHRVQAIIPQRCYPDALPSPGVFTVASGSKSDYDDAGVLRVARG